ncbi:hypothetical protein IAU60_006542 [Kwoniella sp. DSM 27419]
MPKFRTHKVKARTGSSARIRSREAIGEIASSSAGGSEATAQPAFDTGTGNPAVLRIIGPRRTAFGRLPETRARLEERVQAKLDRDIPEADLMVEYAPHRATAEADVADRVSEVKCQLLANHLLELDTLAKGRKTLESLQSSLSTATDDDYRKFLKASLATLVPMNQAFAERVAVTKEYVEHIDQLSEDLLKTAQEEIRRQEQDRD